MRLPDQRPNFGSRRRQERHLHSLQRSQQGHRREDYEVNIFEKRPDRATAPPGLSSNSPSVADAQGRRQREHLLDHRQRAAVSPLCSTASKTSMEPATQQHASDTSRWQYAPRAPGTGPGIVKFRKVEIRGGWTSQGGSYVRLSLAIDTGLCTLPGPACAPRTATAVSDEGDPARLLAPHARWGDGSKTPFIELDHTPALSTADSNS